MITERGHYHRFRLWVVGTPTQTWRSPVTQVWKPAWPLVAAEATHICLLLTTISSFSSISLHSVQTTLLLLSHFSAAYLLFLAGRAYWALGRWEGLCYLPGLACDSLPTCQGHEPVEVLFYDL